MQNGLYVALSSQIALERRLTTIADNVANAGTVGFRATQVKFEDIVTGTGANSISFVSTGGTYLSDVKGGFRNTGNQLDFAIRGDAWFGIETPDGPVMTRDGRFTMLQSGQIVSVEGYPVLDASGTPLQVDPAGGAPSVSADGFMRQNGEQVGAIGLFSFEPGADFRRYGNSGVVPVGTPEPLLDRAEAGVIQGFVEDSNVNPVLEMTRLIMVQRAFESAHAAIRETESTFGDAVKTLGTG
ncbi:MAG: flagellar basal-body rod protein FlgF [Mesorhizobium sp.]|nr:flagellar basal-body rod protein FlgF [Mesorhizobium sp.]